MLVLYNRQSISCISGWSADNHFQLNPITCKQLVISFKKVRRSFDSVEIDSLPFEIVSATKILGVTIRSDLKWIDHVEDITTKLLQSVCIFSDS